jgi:hypothetical protein
MIKREGIEKGALTGDELKKAWSTPSLVSFGSVSMLTTGNLGSFADQNKVTMKQMGLPS